jgi:hypothetical protein
MDPRRWEKWIAKYAIEFSLTKYNEVQYKCLGKKLRKLTFSGWKKPQKHVKSNWMDIVSHRLNRILQYKGNITKHKVSVKFPIKGLQEMLMMVSMYQTKISG